MRLKNRKKLLLHSINQNQMTTFKSIFEQYNWDEVKNKIYQTTSKDVETSLAKAKKKYR